VSFWGIQGSIRSGFQSKKGGEREEEEEEEEENNNTKGNNLNQSSKQKRHYVQRIESAKKHTNSRFSCIQTPCDP
jgi:hypothetical protein